MKNAAFAFFRVRFRVSIAYFFPLPFPLKAIYSFMAAICPVALCSASARTFLSLLKHFFLADNEPSAARITYSAALQHCKIDAPLLAAGLLTLRIRYCTALILKQSVPDVCISARRRKAATILYYITPEFTVLHWLNVYGWLYAVGSLGNFNC